MELADAFLLWQDIGLLLYATLKAFLPLPSLEVMLVPLCLSQPSHWILYSLEGALGTCVGGMIGYAISYRYGRRALRHLANEKEMNKGEELMQRYGLWAVFIGGITPIPDFLLAYLAGLSRMNLWRFSLCDGLTRLLRSLLVCYMFNRLGILLDFDQIGIWLSVLVVVWLLLRYFKQKRDSHSKGG